MLLSLRGDIGFRNVKLDEVTKLQLAELLDNRQSR
jgi:hypothetical protein